MTYQTPVDQVNFGHVITQNENKEQRAGYISSIFCVVYCEVFHKFASVFLEEDLCQYNHDWNKGEHPNWNCKGRRKNIFETFLKLTQTNDECFNKADLPRKRRVMATFSFVPDNIKKNLE